MSPICLSLPLPETTSVLFHVQSLSYELCKFFRFFLCVYKLYFKQLIPLSHFGNKETNLNSYWSLLKVGNHLPFLMETERYVSPLDLWTGNVLSILK